MDRSTSDSPAVRQQVERNYRWNFTFNVLDGASFWFGMSFISATVILPLYVRHFTSDPVLIGLIPFLSSVGLILPQPFLANWVERSPKKKFFPVTLGFFGERMPIFLLAPAAALLTGSPTASLVVFFVLWAWFGLGGGIVSVGWQDMVAKIIPTEKRGRFFGITNFIGNGTGILGAVAVPVVLERLGYPLGYIVAFIVAAVLILASWIFISLTREPEVRATKPPVSQLHYFRSLPALLRRDHNFRSYLVAQVVFALSGMATGFLVVYSVQRWHLPDSQASAFTVALQIGLALGNLLFGLLADRKGHKLSLEISFAFSVLLLLLAIAAPSPLLFFAVFFLRGAVNGGTFVSGISIVYEFTDAESRATYIALANTIPGIFAAIAPLLGGWLAAVVGYRAMFALSAVTGVASWFLIRFSVREPRTHAVAG